MKRQPTEKELALAEKITSTAEAGLHNFDVTVNKWPAEFQAIMWEAIAEIASRRAQAARDGHGQCAPTTDAKKQAPGMSQGPVD